MVRHLPKVPALGLLGRLPGQLWQTAGGCAPFPVLRRRGPQGVRGAWWRYWRRWQHWRRWRGRWRKATCRARQSAPASATDPAQGVGPRQGRAASAPPHTPPPHTPHCLRCRRQPHPALGLRPPHTRQAHKPGVAVLARTGPALLSHTVWVRVREVLQAHVMLNQEGWRARTHPATSPAGPPPLCRCLPSHLQPRQQLWGSCYTHAPLHPVHPALHPRTAPQPCLCPCSTLRILHWLVPPTGLTLHTLLLAAQPAPVQLMPAGTNPASPPPPGLTSPRPRLAPRPDPCPCTAPPTCTTPTAAPRPPSRALTPRAALRPPSLLRAQSVAAGAAASARDVVGRTLALACLPSHRLCALVCPPPLLPLPPVPPVTGASRAAALRRVWVQAGWPAGWPAWRGWGWRGRGGTPPPHHPPLLPVAPLAQAGHTRRCPPPQGRLRAQHGGTQSLPPNTRGHPPTARAAWGAGSLTSWEAGAAAAARMMVHPPGRGAQQPATPR